MSARTRTAAEARQAVIGILSRPGSVDAMADEICDVFARVAKPAAAEAVRRCQRPEDPHSGTALVGGMCPICFWRPA